MANYFLSMCLLRIALPTCLTLSIIFRPSLLSAMYLLLLLYLPVVPVPTTRTMAGHTGCYLKIVIGISFLTSISQLAFQIVLLSLQPYGRFLNNCDFLEQILRHVGFIRLNELSATYVVQWLSPEIVMLFSSIAIYIFSNKLNAKRRSNHPETTTEEGQAGETEPKPKRKFGFVVVVGRYVCLVSLAIAACLRPSIVGGFYFLIFLGGATWWACYKELRKAFAYVCRVVLVVLFFHICILYGYQFQWPQEYLKPNSTYARYFGLTPLVNTSCDDPRAIVFNDVEWASYLNPIWLLWLYYVLALESKLLLMPQPKRKTTTFSHLDGRYNGAFSRQLPTRTSSTRLVRAGTTHHRWQSATRKVRVFTKDSLTSERTPLMSGVSPSRKYGVGSGRSILQDSTGSVTITTDVPDEIPMKQLGKGTAEGEPQSSNLDNFLYAMDSIMQVLIRSSYIATNITMMAWSITYHSWLTFVLLLWAILLWLLPNQRRAMLRSAPFLVIYAEFLLISAYIYGMNLTEDELPSKVANFNLAQIGFEKILVLPCKPLLVKCLYTMMFWITLRQFMHERQEARQTSALADMVAPLEVSVGTATSAIPEEESEGSKFMKKLGEVIKKLLTKFWIWHVTINLFIVAITGERMTSFRIIYMFLFLFFILTLQFSFRIWRKIMYGFWLIVIGYSMLTLVLVYTYQFDNFPNYWTTYLHIPPEQQLDIGLETYETKQLFVRLLTPTYFVMTTVIQLHYFHKDFLEISNLKSPRATITVTADPRSETSSAQGGPWEPESERTDTVTIERPSVDLKAFKDKNRCMAIIDYISHKCKKYSNYIYLYIELHIIKIIFLVALLLTVYDTCAIHFVILLFAVIGVTLSRNPQIIVIHLCSIVVSVMLLARMLYQIKYIDHSKWDVYCDNSTNSTNTTEYNNAEWLGFSKIPRGRALPSVVKWYIGFLTVVTIRSIIDYRQLIWRLSQGTSVSRPFFMFPKVTRHDADKSVKKCLKYLTNYGFYKFGVEVSFMATVALIGTRMDFYACLYGLWLSMMFKMERKKLAKIWNCYLVFIAIIIPVQYFMVVGLPPGLCIIFPWDIEGVDERLRRMQDWMYLLDIKYPPSAYKLICDIFVLILVARQSVVFRIERRYEGSNPEYTGGSNESIIHQMEDPTFVNPVPDFITYIRSWLDIFKRGVLQSFMWITLAIVFLAGTNRVNIFSLGYLAGSFIFLWQGSDLYLRPIANILKAWNWLVGYNVFVILIKTILQIWGCIFINDVSACWLLRLLGIGCIKKFGISPLLEGVDNEQTCQPVPREDIGLAWDGLCFGFLIMQRRIFTSYNFFHIVDEAKATTILASRGAELIEELREKQMFQKAEQEGKILEKIKHKMDRIKATQQKIQGPHYKETTNHFVDKIFPGSRPLKPHKVPTTYKTAIRSGDYYMFDDLEDEELDLISEKSDYDDDDLEHDDVRDPRKMTVGELLSQTMKKDNLELVVRKPSPQRRASMPLARQQSYMSTRSRLSAPLPLLFRSAVGSPRRSAVTIHEEPNAAKMEPKPGSSKQQPEDEMSLLSEEKIATPSKCRDFVNVLLFIWRFIESVMNTITNCLNRSSRDYRYVLRVLSKEKKILKEKTNFRSGVRRHSAQIWEPATSFQDLIRETSEDSADTTASLGDISPTDSYRRALGADRSTHADGGETVEFEQQPSSLDPIIPRQKKDTQTNAEYDRRKASVLTVPEIRILAPSLERGLDDSPRSQTPVNIMEDYETAEMSSIDQSPVVRLLQSIWFLILSNSDILCYIMIFLNQMQSASLLSLPLPLLVFVWGTLTIPRPSKTFWITIIAYTEVVVLIKCIFQFKILDEGPATVNNPFYPARIIGIERTQYYATFDLLLLLVVFFHRIMLKTLGLWKTSYLPPKPLKDGIYRVEYDDDDDDDETLSSKFKPGEAPKLTALKLSHPQRETIKEEPLPQSLDEEEIDSDKSLVKLTIEEVRTLENMPGVLGQGVKKYFESTTKFFSRLLDPTSRITVDVYAYMFMCDFFNFMVIIFGFSAFGTQQGDGGVSAYLQENRVPIPFLLMLILQFILIIVDRALFLRKYILGKIIFQFIQIIGVHIWMFFVLPAITERKFNALLPPQMWYMVKCLYLLLSAYQIRCGYPTRILGNFLCKGYNYANMFLFKGFMAIPFLFELRTIMDWMWTDTSMTIMDWLKMEDIFAHIFLLKCARHVESEYPQPRGEKKNKIVKYFMGGACLFAIIAVIWFPLVFFALGNTVGESNIPYDVTVSVRIGPYQPIYSMSAQTNSIYGFTETEYGIMTNNYKKNRVALTFLSSYDNGDVAAVILNGNSTMVWAISPPDIERMLDEVESDNELVLRLNYVISRASNSKDPGIISSEIEVKMPAKINNEPNPERITLAKMLKNNASSTSAPVHVSRIFPKFVKVTNRNIATPVYQLMYAGESVADNSLRDLKMRLSRSAPTETLSSLMWWELKEDCNDTNYKKYISKIPRQNCEYLVMYTFNEKSFPASLSFLSGGGIVGLYTTLVFVASRMIRGFFSEICFKIMFDDMPNVDRILQLCLDIYLVREARELCLEEDLFAKLVFLFRSPETLIKWTRPKEEDENDGDDPDDEPQQPAIEH